MSAIKNHLHDCLDQAEIADLKVYEADSALICLANLAWHAGWDVPVWAPDQEWIDVTRTQLQSCLGALEELQAARDSMNARK